MAPRYNGLAIALAAVWTVTASAECVEPKRKPIKVEAVCGIAFDDYPRRRAAHESVEIIDDNHLNYWAAKTETDADGRFEFVSLTKGKYWLGVNGFGIADPIVEVTKSNSSKCSQRLYIVVKIGECKSYVTTKKPDFD
jgi:hypothetical protein